MSSSSSTSSGLGDDAGGVWGKNWSYGHGLPKGSRHTFGDKKDGWWWYSLHTDGKVYVPQVWTNRDDPATRRTLHSSGLHQYHTSVFVSIQWLLDMMQVNIINEKIYFFLWFWFVALAIISGVQQVLISYTAIVFHFVQKLQTEVQSRRHSFKTHDNWQLYYKCLLLSDLKTDKPKIAWVYPSHVY